MNPHNGTDILGVTVNANDVDSAMQTIKKSIAERRVCTVYTPNASIIEKCSRSEKLRRLINSATLRIPDGAGVSLASRILYGRTGKVSRVTGIDLAYRILQLAAKLGLRVFFLGAKPGVAAAAAQKMSSEIPGLSICGSLDGYGQSKNNLSVCRAISDARADIVFVCLGFPRQEMWICANRSALPDVRLFMGLGGTFDVWSGNVKRAPLLLQNIGLEWLWRVLNDPADRLHNIPTLMIFLAKTLHLKVLTTFSPRTFSSKTHKSALKDVANCTVLRKN